MANGIPEKLRSEIINFIRKEKENKTYDAFNIFEVAGISTSEDHLSNILVELLNQKGTHGEGRTFLNLFFTDVLDMPIPSSHDDVSVYREVSTDKHRRIDIVITTSTHFIPIEVKIYARDRQRQCADYLEFAKTQTNRDVKLFYLTPNKRKPPVSSADKSYGYITVLSWDMIIKWLRNCVKVAENNNNYTVRCILHQFISIITRFIINYKIFEYKEAVVSEGLKNLCKLLPKWNIPKTKDDRSITYFASADEDKPLFFRVQSDNYNPCIIAGLITGARLNDGNWVFSGKSEDFKKNYESLSYIRGNGANSFWVRKEIIVPYGKFYRLFDIDEDNNYLHHYASSIEEFYNRIYRF